MLLLSHFVENKIMINNVRLYYLQQITSCLCLCSPLSICSCVAGLSAGSYRKVLNWFPHTWMEDVSPVMGDKT